eukprot:gb/GECG01007494.1/.p1 GENE.gb/GECG01007494.1/~~gb/GECG01007494.1/.p1  ORF type:complete len:162 (+),score=16.54 gb/GECG01007494.1/:1-486(+)
MADADAVNFCSISQVDQDALQRVVTEKPDVKRLRQVLKKYPKGACNSIRFGLDGKATLHSAAMFGYDKIADALLSEFGADVHQKTTMLKMTPLHLACQVGSLKCVRLFIEDYGALSDVEVKDDVSYLKSIGCVLLLRVLSFFTWRLCAGRADSTRCCHAGT